MSVEVHSVLYIIVVKLFVLMRYIHVVFDKVLHKISV